ncbi:MAG TPA: hypothetical protein PKB12_06065 [Elusimicrobiota bacterium]|nr:hypothetical protein [Elusimicrobiota bacterium]HND64086.1 hypothetical protein [Elusimicrobiota bacterium]
MVNPLARRLILFGVLAAALFPPRARAEDVSVSSSTTPTEPAYVYKGDRMRDPFIPLNGQGGATMDSAIAKVDLGPFNPAGAELKGILKTPTGRWALIRTTDGLTYMVQNGRVYDPKRKLISGFQGIVKEKTVVILAPGNQEFELRTKKDEEAAKKQ